MFKDTIRKPDQQKQRYSGSAIEFNSVFLEELSANISLVLSSIGGYASEEKILDISSILFQRNSMKDREEKSITERISDLFREIAMHPNEEKARFYREIENHIKRNKLSETEKEPLKNEHPYPGLHEDALEWLKNIWGSYLKFFGADDDRIYQDQLYDLDKPLMNTLRYNSKYRREIESKGLKLADIIPTKKERLSKEIKALAPKTRYEVLKLERVSMKRRYDKRKKQSAEATENILKNDL